MNLDLECSMEFAHHALWVASNSGLRSLAYSYLANSDEYLEGPHDD